ncbi:response regulator [Glaciecola sp. 2405UD65-10]|uniref:response regulator n=1 Tax=Glaciecola sp. 2405UD65-10 TaxID=3397244 RepID=UPI003B5ABC69
MNIRILVVDNSPSIRQMISITLKSAKYIVTTVENGQAALALCERMLFDLIITDTSMAKMDGLTLIGYIRKLHCYRDVPIMLITNETSAQAKAQGKQAGATECLVKPLNPQHLLSLTAKVLA